MAFRSYGLVLREDERDELLELCNEEGICILFPQLFSKTSKHHLLWGFDINGIGLVGTVIMAHMQASGIPICYGVKELKKFFETDEWKEHKAEYGKKK